MWEGGEWHGGMEMAVELVAWAEEKARGRGRRRAEGCIVVSPAEGDCDGGGGWREAEESGADAGASSTAEESGSEVGVKRPPRTPCTEVSATAEAGAWGLETGKES